MGTDIHLVLERRVKTAATVQARAALEAAQLPLPDDLVELCAPPEQHEWIGVRYDSWLNLDDEGFKASAALFDAVYARVLGAGDWIEAEQRRRDPRYARCVGDDGWWPTAVLRATTAARAALGLETQVTRSAGGVCARANEPEAWLEPGGGFELARRSYARFALLSSTARETGDPANVLACMCEGVTEGSKAEQAGDHSFCWCPLYELLATEWSAAQRAAMGEECLRELERLGQRIVEAGLHLSDHRLLFSFSS